MILAAEGVPEIGGIALPVLALGTLLLVLYVARRLAGHDMLPEGPPPRVPFRVYEVFAILIGSVMLQATLYSLLENAGIASGTRAYLLSYVGPVGIVLAVHELLEDRPSPTRTEVQEAISGNLCRCTGYHPIVDAVLTAARQRT